MYSWVRILVWAGVFLILFYQNETKGEEICGHQRVGELDRVKLGLFNFKAWSAISYIF